MIKKITLIALSLFYSLSVFSWGKQGHLITGDIAQVVTKKPIQDSVNKYLEGMKWGDAATWMDEVRSDHSYDYMKTWHYMNVEKDKTYVKSSEENVINEIDIAIDKLKNRSKLTKQEISTNIKVLFHLIGDMHQPLHVGYGEDKGGNTVDVDFLGKSTNLHKVWDSEIINEKKITTASLEELYKKTTPVELKKISKIDVTEWMNEGRALLPGVYDFKKGIIEQNYVDKNAEIIKKQLLYGGIRISSVLTSIFSNP